ncbi:endo-1,4-beta-xylanase [Lihuaxuella thermophila]|uniref:endo-1,4-beta-xylanase n=1 Tax=Lihuaxuella thermophila TaxID=1173111 RepID=A0A1H8CFD1_9BACL|nr:endo-1,4-beta-xylanase [Lihuaxuella thermophila]SEM93682.1 endo-1,4-beta-xylanase [Lihuaxuella thermophila]
MFERFPINRRLLYLCLFLFFMNLLLILWVYLISKTNETKGTSDRGPGAKTASLRELASSKSFQIGSSVRFESFISERTYRQRVNQEFNMITIANELKFETIHSKPNQFDFSKADFLVDFAMEKQIHVRGQTLIQSEALPGWVTQGDHSKEEIKQMMKKHIQTIVSHYKGRVATWNVVSGAFNDDGSFRDNFWLRTIGPEYIELAFRWAHEADPHALLFYDDHQMERWNAKSQTVYQMVSEFKKRSVPIHGIGIRIQTDSDQQFSSHALSANMNRFSNLGMQVQIIDFDVKIKNNNLPFKENLKKQAELYGIALKACLSSSHCTAFMMQGFTDKYTRQQESFPLIFDINYKPKPAYFTLMHILSQNNAASRGGTSLVRFIYAHERRLLISTPIVV